MGRSTANRGMKFEKLIEDTFKDAKRDLIILDRELKKDKNGYDRKWYKYKCNKCGWGEGWIQENNLLVGKGCSCCSGRSAVLGINTIWDTDRWMCDLGVSEDDAKKYTRCSQYKITVICPNCKEYKNIKIGHIYTYKSIGCNCGDGFSYPEKFMYNILNQLGVEFITEYSPKYLKGKRSDFYIPSFKLVIETDGKLGHRGGVVHYKADKTIEGLIKIDDWKDNQHLLHGVETIRINCFNSNIEYIKNNIRNSKLSNYFNLDKINWLLSDEYAWKSNLKYKVCEYWNNKKESDTVKDLCNIFKLGKTTVRRYLSYGSKLKLCEYNPKKESIKGSIKRGKLNSKNVELFKDGLSLGIFDSTIDLERKSEELFGVKLYNSSISKVCNGIKKTYKGFNFKYINNIK